jgi:hypothetical protein
MKQGRAQAMQNKGPKFLMEATSVGPNGTIRI